MKSNGVKYSLSSDAISRRRGAITRLNAQLESNTKVSKQVNGISEILPLTKKDVHRIVEEIKTLGNCCQS